MKRVFLILLSFSFVISLYSQKNMTNNVSHEVIYPTEFHVTEPLRDIVAKHPFVEIDKEEKESSDRSNRTPQTFLYTAEDGLQYGDDPAVRQTTMGTRQFASNKATIQNWAGQVATGFRPMDPTGAAGTNYYIQIINSTTYKIFNKTNGSNVLTGTLGNLWSPATGNAGDPIVMYDKYADRWFLSQFSSGNDIYIAISTTNDPTGSYYTYTFTSPQFPDYLKFSIWENGYYMTSNQTTDKVFCFERDQMIAGNPSARAISANFTTGSVGGFFVPLPADAADGGLPPAGTPLPFFCYTENSWGGGNIDGVKIWNMTVTWGGTPSASITLNTTLACSAFDGTYDAGWNDITQPGTTQKLDGIGGVPTYRAQWRPWTGYNTVVMNWGVKLSATQRSIRWVELRQDQGTGTWSLYQESTYAPDGDSRWMGSIAMDDNGSIGIAYCKSSSTTFPTLCYTGRLAADPLGTMSFAETVAIAGTSVQTGTNRFGDYSHTSLDPDGITFWHTGEYIAGGVKTRVFSFQLPAGPMPPVANFSANTTTPCIGSTVNFTDFSSGTPTSWAWTFNPTSVTYVGGTNASSQNPQVIFNAAGPYTVTLVATNGNGNDSEIKISYISPVSPGTLPVIENFEGATFPPVGWTIENADGTSTWGTAGAKGLERRAAAGNTGSTSGCAGIELFNYNTDTAQVDNLISIPLSLSGISAAEMTFKRAYKYYNSATNPNNYHDELRVFVSTDCGATWGSALYYKKGANLATNGTINTTFTPSVAADWDTDTIDLTPYANQSIVIKFEIGNRWGNNLYLDDINISATAATAPVANFTANPLTTTCSGDVQFTDASTGAPTSWLWDFGDSQTSTLQNPLHTYTTNGTYSVTLTATNGNGNDQIVKNNYVTINMPVAPTVTPGSNCGTGTVNLAATGAGTIHWFDAPAAGTDLGTGGTFTTPVISTTTTYYVEDHLVQPSQYVGPLTNFGAGQYSNTSYTLTFDCLSSCTLVSVAIDKQVAGSITIQLTNSGGTVLQTGSFAVPAGASRVTLNWPLTPATGLRLVGPTGAGMWRVNTGGTFPYTLSGLVSITGCSSGTRFGSFFDWEIKEPDCISARVPVDATITTGPPASLSISASSSTICSGQSVTFTANPTNGGTTPSYQWQVNGVNAGTNSPNFTSTTLANNDIITCILTSSETCISANPATSNSVTMNVSSAVVPAVAVAASATTICSGTSVTFTATPTNGGTPGYQWQVNGTNVGTNSPTYVNGSLANGNTVTCIMTSSLSCASPATANSNTVTMTVNSNVTPAVAVSASASTICSGTSVTFTATPTNGGTPSYQWTLNGTNVGTNSPTYTNGTLANADVVVCTMTSTASCASPTIATSNSVTMTVNASVTPAVAISASATSICTGTSVTFTATPTNGGTPSYQWTLNGANVGTNSPTYTNGSLADADVVACTMTSTASCASPTTATSNSVTMNVNSAVVPAVSITASSSTICSGQSVTFTATPSNGGTPTYQWTLNGANVGTNSPTYTNGSLADADVVECTMTSSLGCASPSTANSNIVTITVSSSVVPSVAIAASSSTICSGQSVTFTATPTNGGTPNYQWTLNGTNVGTNSPTYTNGTLADADVVACTMTSSLGCANPSTANSNTVTMSVGASVTPSVSIAASATSICTGTSVTFTATPTNGGTPDYLWTLNGVNVGNNSPTYTNGSLADGDIVACSMTSSLGCATPSTASSNPVTISVSNPSSPAVVIAASSTTICSGQSVTFNATSVNGGTPIYQWTLNGTNVGTNNSTYTNNSLTDGDVVACTMTSNAACVNPTTANSNQVTMTVTTSATPTVDILANPSGSICPGTPIVFTANETNGGTPAFIWTVNGLNAGTGNTLSGTYTNGQVIICSMTSSLNCATPASVSSTPYIISEYSVVPVTIVDNSGILSSSEANGNQWYEQNTGIITGETGQDFMPTADGLYYTIVTDANGCTSMSNVIDFIYLTVEHNIAGTSVRIYPNPAQTSTTVEFIGNSSSEIEIELTDVLGRPVIIKKIDKVNGSAKINFDLSIYEKGLYFINVLVNDEQKIYKIIHE